MSYVGFPCPWGIPQCPTVTSSPDHIPEVFYWLANVVVINSVAFNCSSIQNMPVHFPNLALLPICLQSADLIWCLSDFAPQFPVAVSIATEAWNPCSLQAWELRDGSRPVLCQILQGTHHGISVWGAKMKNISRRMSFWLSHSSNVVPCPPGSTPHWRGGRSDFSSSLATSLSIPCDSL